MRHHGHLFSVAMMLGDASKSLERTVARDAKRISLGLASPGNEFIRLIRRRTFVMRRVFLALLVVALILFSGNSVAQERTGAEVTFGVGTVPYWEDVHGAVILGYTSRFVGGEISVFHEFLDGPAVFGANFVLGAFDAPVFVPYATAGALTGTSGGLFDLGVGAKLRQSERLAFRLEYRRFFYGGSVAPNWIVGGISWFF